MSTPEEFPQAEQPTDGIRAKRPARKKRRGRDRLFTRKKVSRLTTDPGLVVDYKNVSLLKTFLTPEGKILPRRITGNTAKQQRQIALAIKRARHLALLAHLPLEH
jgi:small subunit ribosomal protein S18